MTLEQARTARMTAFVAAENAEALLLNRLRPQLDEIIAMGTTGGMAALVNRILELQASDAVRAGRLLNAADKLLALGLFRIVDVQYGGLRHG